MSEKEIHESLVKIRTGYNTTCKGMIEKPKKNKTLKHK